jgi:PLP dependent protein
VEPAAEVARRLREVRVQVEEAARRAGRNPEAVRLLAVSKGQPADAIRAAFDAGQREFGENYAQELAAKAEAVEVCPGLSFHFIGRIQRNKIKQIVKVARVIHAVDRADVAEEIARRAAAAGLRARVLVEVNVGGEASKGGCEPAGLGPLLDAIRAAPALELGGLMTIPPETPDAEGARRYFSRLRELRDRHGGAGELPELSMGMSHDFPVAIEEGATIVRVGTAIFGARPPRASE